MQTQQDHTSPAAQVKAPEATNAPGAAVPGADWHPRKDIMNQMLAYRDWWNMPSRRPAKRGPRATPRPQTDRG